MVKIGDKKIAVYKDDYRPVDILKNAKSFAPFTVGGTDKNEEVFIGTFNDYLTLYGKSEFLNSPNLCPNLKAKSGTLNNYTWQITPNADGTFNFSGAMITGETVGRVTLPAGTYTASGCNLIQLYWDGLDGFLTLPATFTLEKETTVLLVLWYTETYEISRENQYIQIEKGEIAGDFVPYSGKEYSVIKSSLANIKTRGKNIFNFTNGLVHPGEVIETLPFGVIAKGIKTDNKHANSYNNGWYSFSGRTNSYVKLKAGDTVTISLDYTVLEAAEGRTGKEAIGIHFYSASGATDTARTTMLTKGVGQTNRPYVTYNIVEDGIYYPIITLNSNKVKIENIQIEYGSKATEYHPFFGISDVDLPRLYGIEVEKNNPKINYAEIVDEEEKYYISDCFKANKHIQNIGSVTFNGSEEGWTRNAALSNDDISVFSIPCNDGKTIKNAICTHFNYVDSALNAGEFSNDITAQNNFCFAVSNDIATDVGQFKNWLLTQSLNATPVTVYYVLSQPIITVKYVANDISFEPLVAKSFARYTHFLQTPVKNSLGYGTQKSIKIN